MKQAVLNILGEEQIEQLDSAVKEILSDIGLEVASAEILQILVKAGCTNEGKIVRFPGALVRKCIESAPRNFRITGLDPNRQVLIGDGKTHFQPMVGRLKILDADGRRRPTGFKDVDDIVRICDALPFYDILHGGAVMPQIEGVPPGFAHVAGFVQTLRNTRKPFKGSCRGRKVAGDCLAMAGAVQEAMGLKITLHTTCNLVSPLQVAAEMSEGALEYIKAGMPVDFASEPQMGATSPVTLAGTVAQGMAECLSGVVLAQVVNPGCPVFVGTVAAAMDMRHATIALGGIEAALVNAAHAQLARYYGLPSRGTGSNTNSKLLDFQAGYEKMITLLLPVLAGMDMVFYPGTLEHAETVSLESLVLDHDLCAIAARAQEGLRVTTDLLSVDLIRQTGSGGTFIGLPQTAKEMFREHLVKGLWDRRRRSEWEAAGSPSGEAAARSEVDKILARKHNTLPVEVEDVLYDVITAAVKGENADGLIKLLWPEK